MRYVVKILRVTMPNLPSFQVVLDYNCRLFNDTCVLIFTTKLNAMPSASQAAWFKRDESLFANLKILRFDPYDVCNIASLLTLTKYTSPLGPVSCFITACTSLVFRRIWNYFLKLKFLRPAVNHIEKFGFILAEQRLSSHYTRSVFASAGLLKSADQG